MYNSKILLNCERYFDTSIIEYVSWLLELFPITKLKIIYLAISLQASANGIISSDSIL